jgi:hypothetical protein
LCVCVFPAHLKNTCNPAKSLKFTWGKEELAVTEVIKMCITQRTSKWFSLIWENDIFGYDMYCSS